jgi:hypothetical protein
VRCFAPPTPNYLKKHGKRLAAPPPGQPRERRLSGGGETRRDCSLTGPAFSSTVSGLILCFVIPAKAGIYNYWRPGFRIKCGMTTYLIEPGRLPMCGQKSVFMVRLPGCRSGRHRSGRRRNCLAQDSCRVHYKVSTDTIIYPVEPKGAIYDA